MPNIRAPRTAVKGGQKGYHGGVGDPTIRKATAADCVDCARLILASAEHFMPAVFGPRIPRALPILAAGAGTLFSHTHAWVAEAPLAAAGNPGIAGMLLGYTGREKAAEDPRTGLALLRLLGPRLLLRLGPLLRLQGMIGRVDRRQFYISNVAVYPDRRGRGIGWSLLCRAESEARSAGASEMVLDVETDNHGARRLYERSGYLVQSRTTELRLGGQAFSFYRMGKPLAALSAS